MAIGRMLDPPASNRHVADLQEFGSNILMSGQKDGISEALQLQDDPGSEALETDEFEPSCSFQCHPAQVTHSVLSVLYAMCCSPDVCSLALSRAAEGGAILFCAFRIQILGHLFPKQRGALGVLTFTEKWI